MSILHLSRYAKLFQKNNGWWLFHSPTGTVARLTEEFVQTPEFESIRKRKGISINSVNPVVHQMHKLHILLDDLEFNEEDKKVKNIVKQKLHKKHLLELVILPTEKCNFRCVYCYEDFSKGRMSPDTISGIKNLVKNKVKKTEIEELRIRWFGGEPLLAKDIVFELSGYFLEIAERYNINYYAGMTTNGYFLNPKTFVTLNRLGVSVFQVSIDGPKYTHDNMRPLANNRGTFDVIWKNLIALSESPEKFTVLLRMNVNLDNYKSIIEWLPCLKNTFLENDPRFLLHFHSIFQVDNSHEPTVSNKQSNKMLLSLYKKAHDLGLQTDLHSLYHPTSLICYAAHPSSIVIGSDGMLYKCTVAFDLPENQVGQLYSDGTLKLNDNLNLWIQESIDDEVCVNCILAPQCAGASCPLPRINGTVKRQCPSLAKQLDEWIPLIT